MNTDAIKAYYEACFRIDGINIRDLNKKEQLIARLLRYEIFSKNIEIGIDDPNHKAWELYFSCNKKRFLDYKEYK